MNVQPIISNVFNENDPCKHGGTGPVPYPLWLIGACTIIGQPHLAQYWPSTGQPEQCFNLSSSAVACWMLLNMSSDQSCTRALIHNKIDFIIPGCPRPSMGSALVISRPELKIRREVLDWSVYHAAATPHKA